MVSRVYYQYETVMYHIDVKLTKKKTTIPDVTVQLAVYSLSSLHGKHRHH